MLLRMILISVVQHLFHLMPVKKSQIYSSLWSACDELRGGMDASQYKDYILTLLFIKYISDLHKAGRRSLIVVPRGASFDDMYAIRHERRQDEQDGRENHFGQCGNRQH